MSLTVSLLGSVQVTWNGQPITFATTATRALLAYLAVEAERPHSREMLAALLLPEKPQAAAYNNLRQTLSRLRRPFPASAPSFLDITPAFVQFRSETATLDVALFETWLAECRAHVHPDITRCPACLHRLQQAVTLYRGEFLHGLILDDSQPFQEWTLFRRERLHRLALEALHTLALAAEAATDYDQMRHYAERQLALEPWREDAHGQLMRALAYQGQRSAALAQYEICCRVVSQELGIEPGVELQVLSARIRAGDLSPAHLTTPLPHHNLPTHLTPFIGRERELAEIAARLQQPQVRLLTLVGAGGMGKTRLAVEAAQACLDAYADGVFFVSLAALNTTDALAPTIASAIGLTVEGGNPQQAVLQALRTRQMLLILDNFEHLLDGIGFVVELLQTAPRLQILMTSRQRLNGLGEHVYLVEGMEYDVHASLAEAETTAAARLFVQSGRRVQPDFALTEATLTDFLRICQLVQGMPLGLELAAAWVEMLPLDQIAAEIEQSAEFLAYDARDAPPRQRSIRAVFDWSWRLLSATERQALCQVSVFRGGFTREAAQTIVGATLQVLTRLVYKSLLRWSRWQEGGGRYEMHELVRQFAAEQLDAAGERAAVEARHGEFYLAFIAARETQLARNLSPFAAAESRHEVDNVGQAWVWAARHARVQELERSSYGVWLLYDLASRLPECERLFRLASECVEMTVAQAIRDSQDTRPAQKALSALLGTYANILVQLSKHEAAFPIAQQAIALGQVSGGVIGETAGYLTWGQLLYYRAQHVEAQHLLEHTLQLARGYQLSHTASEWMRDLEWLALLWLWLPTSMLGDYAAAQTYVDAALALCQSLGTMRGEFKCWVDRAMLAHEAGDYGTARRGYEQALTITRQVGYRWGEGRVQLGLGNVVRLQGEYALAHDLTQRARKILGETGDVSREALAWSHLGRLHCYVGNYAHARECLEQSLRLSQEIQARAAEFVARLSLAILSHHTGQDEDALAYALKSTQLTQERGSRSNQAQASVILGHAQARLQRWHEAAATYEHALRLYETLGKVSTAAEARAGLASVALAQDDRALALAHAEAILQTLDHNPRPGLDEPFFVYLTCYRVLDAGHDPRATTVLKQGHALLQEYAHHIQNDALRRSFLENVAVHRELRQAYTAVHSRRNGSA